MTVQELLTALQEGLEDGSWRPDSPIAIFNADSGHFHDLDGPRPHMPEDQEGDAGDCVLCISG